MMTDQEADDAVDRGYLWLVSQGPGYGLDASRIDVDAVNVESSYDCPVGQASIDGRSFARTLTLVFPERNRDFDVSRAAVAWARARGFLATDAGDGYGNHSDYPVLTAAWQRKLLAVRAEQH